MTAEPLAAEDQARANFYALLARLFYAPPDRELLDTLTAAGEREAAAPGSPLAGSLQELARAAAHADADAVREEYETVFVGTGKAEVTLYTSAYRAAEEVRNPLVEIREFMAQHAFVRRSDVFEPEDHIAALCEVMRHLVLQGDTAAQRDFFETFVWPAAGPLCSAILEQPRVAFYRNAVGLAKLFLEVEHAAFEMD